MIPLKDLRRQYLAMKEEMDAALMDTVASGSFVMGDAVSDLERQLADYVGVKHCISCGNGTDALLLSLTALDIGTGDAVFVPDFTFFATAEVVASRGATPVFVDVCPSDFNMDVSDLESKIADVVREGRLRPAAVIAVDLFGLPARYDRIRPVCQQHAMWLIEDGAQGFGGSLRGQKSCSFGDISTTSFFPAKPLGCYGDGGAVFCNNDEWAERLRSLRVHGKGSDKYDNRHIGMNSRLDSIQAAILQVKLRHFDQELDAMHSIAKVYHERLCDKVSVPVVEPDAVSSWAQYVVQTDHRDDLQRRLNAAGIAAAVYYPRTMSQQSAFAYLHQQPCPEALRLTQRVLALPMHPYLTDDEIQLVTTTI